LELYLIRHWKTKGNLEKRYIGTTDEPILSGSERDLWEKRLHRILADVRCVAVSPMKRCRESAELLFPGKKQEVCDAFRECDFGQFENRNYEELKNRPEYQRWIDSGGMEAFPGGESRERFAGRCVEGFVQKVTELQERKIERAAFVVHGGTIMAILEWLDHKQRPFYQWQAENGAVFYVRTEREILRGTCKEIRKL
jgi:alpha-ribazole phosphatase